MFQPFEGLAAVFGHVQMHIRLVDAIKLVRTRKQLLVIVRSRAARQVLVPLLPGLAAVFRPPEAASAVVEFDRGVDDVWILRAHRDACLAHHSLWQAF